MKHFFSVLFLFFTFSLHAFDPAVFRNNKEALSRQVSNEDVERMKYWLKQRNLSEEQMYHLSSNFLNGVLSDFVEQDTYCDLYLPYLFLDVLKGEGVVTRDDDIYQFYVYLRHSNLIDDLFYDLLKKSTRIVVNFEQNKNRPIGRRPLNLYKRYSRVDDLEKFYQPFKSWPDEVDSCTIQTYLRHINQLNLSNSKSRNKDLKKLNWLGYQQGILSLENYNRLEILREAYITNWPITTARYIDIIKNAKDKKAIVREESSTDDFNMTYVLRKENITRRGKLYAAYNSTQIFLMSQIIERTAKRMDAKYVELSFQYTDDPEGEGEIYVLSPMEQYRVSINMLKKEIAELVRSETFRGTPLEYADIIAASYETGLLKSEDIEQVLKFEDFWNPKVSRWQAYRNYAFSLAGTATYYLPPPWNILGAVGLIMTQMKLTDKPEADPDDNWNSII
ncbi:MAG: hypothetical protein WCY48_07505 [Candidatus Caldatribacteriota bacterium]